LQSGVEEHGSHNSFKTIRKKRRLVAAARFFFAATEAQMLTKSQAACRPLERARVDQPRATFRKLAFRPIGKILEQILACQQVENGVAQKLQPFVVSNPCRDAVILAVAGAQIGNDGTVRQRKIEKRPVLETDTQLLFEPLIVTLVHEIRADFPGEGFTWGHLAWSPRASLLRPTWF